jgi:uncharacterized protein (TIGR03086 family)
MADILNLYERAGQEFNARVLEIDDESWTAPTPCADWDVRALVRHLVYECLWIPPLLEGESIADIGDRFEGDILGEDPKHAWSEALQASIASLMQPGALTRTVELSMGPTSGEGYARQVMTDLVIHAWDLARAIGAEERLDPELVEEIASNPPYDVAGGRAAGYFGEKPELPANADAQTKLLAEFGRRA